MNRLLRPIIFLLIAGYTFSLSAQELSVTSFRLLENDLTANTYATMVKDQNGEVAALIKVVTSESGFVFDGGMVGIVKTKQEAGEIWVYVPHGIKRITIRHSKFGVLRDYYFPVAIEKARTYEMLLKTPVRNRAMESDMRYGLFSLQYQPHDAKVFINDRVCTPISEGKVARELPYGEHIYRVEAEGYVTQESAFVIEAEEMNRNVTLRSKIAKLTLKSSVEDGELFLDGKLMGKGEWSGELLARNYIAEVRKSGYIAAPVTFTLGAGADTIVSLNVEKSPILTVKTPFADGHIYVDGEYKGIRECTVALPVGMHVVELKQMSSAMIVTACETDTVMLSAGDVVTLEMTDPRHWVGTLNIVSEPEGCEIYYRGFFIGHTPLEATELSVGGYYPIMLYKEGYEPEEFDANVVKDQTTEYSVRLKEQGSKEEEIPNTAKRNLGTEPLTITVNGVDFTMIPVKGGLYEGKTLSDYYIGETEVTRELWDAVLGGKSYPHPFGKIPADKLSWYECQAFIKALNSLTNRRFKLPTSAQWEYAAQGGQATKGYRYSGGNNADRVAWYDVNSNRQLERVKLKHPNELGLYDMNGNVCEWCSDFVAPSPQGGVNRIVKGGSANSSKEKLTIIKDQMLHSQSKERFVGLRLVLEE